MGSLRRDRYSRGPRRKRAAPEDVFIGETYTIDPGDNLRMETITVLDVQGAGPGSLQLRATFNNPHTAGVTFTNMPFPLWVSTKRFNLVVVDAIAAADPNATQNQRASRAHGSRLSRRGTSCKRIR